LTAYLPFHSYALAGRGTMHSRSLARPPPPCLRPVGSVRASAMSKLPYSLYDSEIRVDQTTSSYCTGQRVLRSAMQSSNNMHFFSGHRSSLELPSSTCERCRQKHHTKYACEAGHDCLNWQADRHYAEGFPAVPLARSSAMQVLHE